MKTYETERLIIKPITLDDAAFLLDLYNRPKFIQYIGDKNLRSISDAQTYIQNRFLPQLERSGFGNYTITLKENNEIIGAVGIFEREGLPIMDIGYSFLEEYEGKGYAYEAAIKVKEIGMKDFGWKNFPPSLQRKFCIPKASRKVRIGLCKRCLPPK